MAGDVFEDHNANHAAQTRSRLSSIREYVFFSEGIRVFIAVFVVATNLEYTIAASDDGQRAASLPCHTQKPLCQAVDLPFVSCLLPFSAAAAATAAAACFRR